MDLHVDLGAGDHLAASIYRDIVEAILDGRLRRGDRLPSTRQLAAQLDVARSTVTYAYDRLVAEGFLVSRVGAGTYVGAQQLPGMPARSAPRGEEVRPRPVWRSLQATSAMPADTARYDFSVGVPDARLFPSDRWRQLMAAELRSAAARSGRYAAPEGTPEARAAIARHIGVSRSVQAHPDDVIVTRGAQQAIDLIGRVLIEPGDRVAVEEPGYPPVRHLLTSLGAQVVGVPVDADGLDVRALPADARLVYVTPSHQFPLGTPMSLARRSALLDWAREHDAVVVEDDYDSEFRFGQRPLQPLQTLDPSGRVIYVGSFSKTLLPSLRLGFLVAPASLRPALRTARSLTDSHGDPAAQGALARFIDSGDLARHVRRASRAYADRWDRTVTRLGSDLGRWLEVVPSAAGLHVCARVRRDAAVDVDQVLERAREKGVRVESLAAYCATSPVAAGLVIGYGAVDADDIDRGLALLAGCFSSSSRR